MKAVAMVWVLALLIGCTAVPDNVVAHSTDGDASEQPGLESLHDLAMMAATASLAEVVAFLGPVQKVRVPSERKQGRSSGCFSTDDLPETVVAEEYFPLDSEPRRFDSCERR